VARTFQPGLRSIVFDCAHPYTLAAWWAETLPGYHLREYRPEDLEWLRSQGIQRMEDDPSVVMDPERDDLPTIWFNRVPEGKVGKNRVHVDVNLHAESDIQALLDRGATILRPLDAVPNEHWAIMADPEGNEFCAFPPPAGAM
jgi:hypothetical protein